MYCAWARGLAATAERGAHAEAQNPCFHYWLPNDWPALMHQENAGSTVTRFRLLSFCSWVALCLDLHQLQDDVAVALAGAAQGRETVDGRSLPAK